ncbi:MAG: 4-amino-4-deoxy-L-arabinose transferase-like glycosyltransferase [Parvicellaceae bacterium]
MNFLKRNYIFIVPSVAFLVIRLGLNFDGFYGQDSYEYLRFTDSLTNYYTKGTDPGNYFWPIMYPLISSVFSIIFSSKWVLLLVSFLSFLGVISFSRKILVKLYPESDSSQNVNLYLLLTLALSPYFFRSSIIGMSDMLACFFIVYALYSLLSFKNELRHKWAMLFVASCVLAFMTRYVSAVILIPLIGFFIFTLFKERKWLYLLSSLVIVCLVLTPHILVRGYQSANFLSHEGFISWTPTNFFQSDHATPDGVLQHPYINFMYGFSPFLHPGYLLIGFGLLMFSKYKIKQSFSLFIFSSILLYLIFIIGLRTQNMRFFVPIFPFVIYLLFPAFIRARIKINSKLFIAGVLFAMIAQIGYFSVSFSKFQRHHLLEKSVAARIVELGFTEPIYAFSLDVSLPHRGVENELRNLWSEEYDSFENGAFVLFDEVGLKEQWNGKSPMINWDHLNATRKLVIIAEFQDGWKLYRIE